MKIVIKPSTIEKIEKLSGQRMTTRCDAVINMTLDVVKNKQGVKEIESQ